MNNISEMILSLACLDLPFENEANEINSKEDLVIKFKNNSILFFRDLR